jgi:hypothetical protein
MVSDGKIVSPVFNVFQILTRGKSPPTACDDYAANGSVSPGLFERFGGLDNHFGIEGIKRFWPIQGDRRD